MKFVHLLHFTLIKSTVSEAVRIFIYIMYSAQVIVTCIWDPNLKTEQGNAELASWVALISSSHLEAEKHMTFYGHFIPGYTCLSF